MFGCRVLTLSGMALATGAMPSISNEKPAAIAVLLVPPKASKKGSPVFPANLREIAIKQRVVHRDHASCSQIRMAIVATGEPVGAAE